MPTACRRCLPIGGHADHPRHKRTGLSMTPSPPVLYFAPGACSRVALTGLEESGLPYEARSVALMTGEQRQPGYLALNPKGKVPLLVTPDGPLSENMAIAHWIDSQAPGARRGPTAASGTGLGADPGAELAGLERQHPAPDDLPHSHDPAHPSRCIYARGDQSGRPGRAGSAVVRGRGRAGRRSPLDHRRGLAHRRHPLVLGARSLPRRRPGSRKLPAPCQSGSTPCTAPGLPARPGARGRRCSNPTTPMTPMTPT